MYCDYKATRKDHVQSVREKVKHGCDYCDYKATTIDSLQTHV